MKKVFGDMLHKLCQTRTKELGYRRKIERNLPAQFD